MKRKMVFVLMAVFLTAAFSIPAFAAENVTGNFNRLVVDEADLLTDEQEDELAFRLEEISERQACEVAVLTKNDLEGKGAEEYADDFFDENGYGYKDTVDGILLMVSMEEPRTWAISTSGSAMTVFTDAGREYIAGKFKPSLSNGDYEEAFEQFAGLCDEFLTQAKTDRPYDTSHMPKELPGLKWIWISLGIGLVIALVVVGSMYAGLRTVHEKTHADEYLRKDSVQITQKRDMYLYRNVTRREKPKESDSSDGGSSIHTGSSGNSHSDSSGSF